MQLVTLGKTKGTIQKSKFDRDREKIKELLKLVGTQTISPSTPTLTNGSYSISNGTW
jgi:ribonucleotide reductase alpha subunit